MPIGSMHPSYGLGDSLAQSYSTGTLRASHQLGASRSARRPAAPKGLSTLHGCTLLVPIDRAFIDSGISTFEPRCWGAHVLEGPYKMEDFYMLDAGRVDTVGMLCQLQCAVNGTGKYVIWVRSEKGPCIKARVLKANIECEHGIVVHIVDRILHPEVDVQAAPLPYVGTMREYGSKSTKDLRADTMETVRGSLRAVHTGIQQTIDLGNQLSGNYETAATRRHSSTRRSRNSNDAMDAPLFARPASEGDVGGQKDLLSADMLVMG